MVTLFEENIKADDRRSSKGNQCKWFAGGIWYKADYTGYEGLAEYMVSHLMRHSSLDENSYILYDTEEIMYGSVKYLGCRSGNFLPAGWQIITLERLFHNFYGESLYKSIYQIQDHESRVQFLVEQIERITGLKKFGEYLSGLLTIDALFLNEDRHTHNIAVLMDDNGKYQYCPIFDNGGALLSDTSMDYPMGGEIYTLIDKVKAKTFCQDFAEQLEIVEKMYGRHIKFHFGKKEVDELLEKETNYPWDIKKRVARILADQKRKYAYLF